MTDLVLIYNHKYEANIPKLDRYYAGKFRKIWHLVPFYRGGAEHVIPVYERSLFFQGFIAQAAKKLKEGGASRFLFIGDDLLLDPGITQENLLEQLGMREDCGFIGEIHDLSVGLFGSGVSFAREATLRHPGFEIGGELPAFDEALKRLERHIKLRSLTLRRYVLPVRGMRRPILRNLPVNWKRFKGNVWHLGVKLSYWFKPKRLEYPLIGGYADIFCVPRGVFDEFAHYCGVFAAAHVFVELAIPTALALSCQRIVTEDASPRRGLSLWFPIVDYREVERKIAFLNDLERKCQYKLANLVADWPRDYLYLHPVKLSKWNW